MKRKQRGVGWLVILISLAILAGILLLLFSTRRKFQPDIQVTPTPQAKRVPINLKVPLKTNQQPQFSVAIPQAWHVNSYANDNGTTVIYAPKIALVGQEKSEFYPKLAIFTVSANQMSLDEIQLRLRQVIFLKTDCTLLPPPCYQFHRNIPLETNVRSETTAVVFSHNSTNYLVSFEYLAEKPDQTYEALFKQMLGSLTTHAP